MRHRCNTAEPLYELLFIIFPTYMEYEYEFETSIVLMYTTGMGARNNDGLLTNS